MLRTLPVYAFIAALGFALPAAAAEIKVGVVDIEYVILKSNKGQQAKKKLKKQFDKKQKELDKRQGELLELKNRLENPSEMDTTDRRKKDLMTYQQGVLKLQEDFVKHQQDLAKQERTLMKPILSKLEDVLTKFAEDGGYDIILNRSQQGVVFAKDAFNITEAILKKFDATK